jgi:hypothetical protein
MGSPLPFRWTGEAMVPLIGFQKRADERFVIGERYTLVEHEERSVSSHNHEFAWLNEAWQSLPESLSAAYPTPEHLRKRALIQAGYYHETAIDAGTMAAAERVAAGVRALDEFAYVIVDRAIVLVRRAKSQARRAMDRKTFQESKTAIMEIVAGMIGVAPAELARSEAA